MSAAHRAERRAWVAYLLPYAGFLVLVELGAPLVLRVAVPLALFALYAARGDYPELRGYRPGLASLADVLVGVGIGALWMAPYLAVPALPRPVPGQGFDPGAAAALGLTLRLVGFAAVTPFVEELFVRSFLLRAVDALPEGRSFRELPVGRFAWRSFVVTSLYFALSHRPWEWWVALPTGVVLNLWLYRRGHIGAVIVAHAVANAAIWLAVVSGPRWLPGTDLWIFL